MSIHFKNLTFGYSELLIKNLSCCFEPGWTAVTGTNGAGKTTLLDIISGVLSPDYGSVSISGGHIYCRQVPHHIPDEAELLFSDDSSEAYRTRLSFGLQDDWLPRWDTLSFGEQKRIQIASAFHLQPEILLLDEPTNHLDSESREILLNALQTFRGTGVIVSHDRSLLDQLPYQVLFLDPPEHDLRSGTYTQANLERQQEASFRKDQREKITRDIRKLENRASGYRNLAKSADSRRSKKNIGRKDHDAKFKMDTARILGKDAIHGKLMNQLQGRIKQDRAKLDSIKTDRKKTFNFALSFEPGRRKTVFSIPEDRLSMGEKVLSFETFELRTEDKAGITGVNGSGKSTLLNHIYQSCRKERTLYVPQELDKQQIRSFFNRINELNSSEKGEIYSIMAALGSEPERVLLGETPSPGEIRKLLIADAIRKKIELLILDEPTNHLDLYSIEALESALHDYRAAMVLVSHDHYFLKNTTTIQWSITENKNNEFHLNN